MIYEMKKGKPEQKRAKKRNNGEKQRKPFQENRLKRKKKILWLSEPFLTKKIILIVW